MSETHRLHTAQEVTHGCVYSLYLSQSQNNLSAFAEVHAAIAKDEKEVLALVSSIQCSDIKSDYISTGSQKEIFWVKYSLRFIVICLLLWHVKILLSQRLKK